MAELQKTLSFRVILLITINSIMGTGIFFLPAIGAGHAGPASLISWLIISCISMYIAMCFAELSSMFPTAGGVYEFCKQAYGRFPSFVIGWMTLVAGNITIAMLVVGAITYLLPADAPLIKIPLSLFFVFVFNFIAFRGMKTSAVMLIAFAFITLIALFGLIIPGLFRMDIGNFTPFFVFPFSSVLVTIFFIAETFFGWETATFLAEETKDGARVMPKALIWGTFIIAIISLLSVITSLGVIPWETFSASAAPLTELSKFHYGGWGEYVFTLLVYLAIIGSVAGWIVSAPRLILAMARDRLFLRQLASIHHKYNTPYKAIIFQTILTSILVFVGAGSYNTLLHLLVPMVLVMYSLVLLSLVVLRYKQPKTKRYYTVPFGKVGPIVIILILLSLIFGWYFEQVGAGRLLGIAGGFILLGIPIFYLLELFYSPKVIEKTDDYLAYFTYFFERFLVPRRVREEIVKLIGNVKGKTILDFGCAAGGLSIHLAEQVGKNGKIYATDISEQDTKIAERRMRRLGHKHVIVIHDHHHTKRVHPKVPKLHAAVSVGMLGYVHDPHTILKHINQRMKIGAKICFVDYDRIFFFLPNIDWIEDDKIIKRYFKDCGFKVKVERRWGLLWQWVYIYGEKVHGYVGRHRERTVKKSS